MFRFSFPLIAWVGIEESLNEYYCFRHENHSERRKRNCGERKFSQRWDEEHRTRKGDIKFLLLELLLENPTHGYDLIKQMEARYGGFRSLSPGSVYPTLQLLEDGGYVVSEQRDGKRIYTITDQGRQFLSENTKQRTTDSTQDNLNRTQELNKLRQSANDLNAVLIQVARTGDVVRINRVQELLAQVKRDIYTILAEK